MSNTVSLRLSHTCSVVYTHKAYPTRDPSMPKQKRPKRKKPNRPLNIVITHRAVQSPSNSMYRTIPMQPFQYQHLRISTDPIPQTPQSTPNHPPEPIPPIDARTNPSPSTPINTKTYTSSSTSAKPPAPPSPPPAAPQGSTRAYPSADPSHSPSQSLSSCRSCRGYKTPR